MYLNAKQVTELNEDGLREFLEKKIPENHYLDYKMEESGKSKKKANVEQLKDITGFANGSGGTLLYGVLEPTEGRSVDDQLQGVIDGSALKKKLEDLTTSGIDPRIHGLKFVSVKLKSERYVVVVHVPPSFSRPHMVTAIGEDDKPDHRFYLRHDESTHAMKTQQIRDVVLSSATAEGRVLAYMDSYKHKVHKKQNPVGYSLENCDPLFLLQAMPLVATEADVDTTSDKLKQFLRAGKHIHHGDASVFGLWFGKIKPSMEGTVAGIEGKNTSEAGEFALHRNGYVHVSYKNPVHPMCSSPKKLRILDGEHKQLFDNFCYLLDGLSDVLDLDLPWVVRCVYLNSKGTKLLVSRKNKNPCQSDPCGEDILEWPIEIREPGSNFSEIAELFFQRMCNAFGEEPPI